MQKTFLPAGKIAGFAVPEPHQATKGATKKISD
jgi:hypothetical protein